MKSKNKYILPILFLFLFAAFYALLKVIPADYNDMHDHAKFARDMCIGKIPYTGNFLVYLLVNVFSFFTAGVKATEMALCGLLALAGTYRYYLTLNKIKNPLDDKRMDWLAVVAAISMLFIFVIPVPGYFLGDYYMYIGTYTPNIWHNSTLLFLFPVALLLFELSFRQLQEFDGKRNYWIFLLIALNLIIKPSYFFVFICVYPLMLLYKYKLKKEFWLGIFPVFLGGILLIGQFIIIYKINTQVIKDTSSVVFMPFYRNPELREDMINIPISMFFSLLFPLIYTIINFRKLIQNQLFWYTFLSFVVSVLIFFFISESGPRASHGNFYWQIVITTWLCFFVALLALLKDLKTERKSVKNIVLLALFGIHTLMGIIYFVRILVTGSYY
ncbi:MAG: hypothetical protein WCL70_08270 [Paludibacter sp.]